MTLTSIESTRKLIRHALQRCRLLTLNLFAGIDYDTFCHQPHPEFSPIGWHLGHIAYSEALWLLERGAGMPPLFPQYRRLFAADGLPKTERGNLPTLPEIRHYLDAVRSQVLNYLETADLERQERLWRFIIQHESQHGETIAFVLQMQKASSAGDEGESSLPDFQTLQIPAGEFEMGNDSLDALDNERPVHRVYLDTYRLDRYPVTYRQYRAFMKADGYQNSQWWSKSGWEWLQANPVTEPLYWKDSPVWDAHPVCGVSWYEAEAYARFVGKRLPTEAEWEKAASWDAAVGRRKTHPWGEAMPEVDLCNGDRFHKQTTPVDAHPAGQSAYGCYDMLGNVWEWTDSWFDGYEGFVSYPYAGYSQVYFDGRHRILKGGSWATCYGAMRCSFRNWYHPHIRQILAGFRCAV